MPIDEKLACVGLFGTCGSSTWREKFVKIYEEMQIAFFNPQLPEGLWETAPEKFARQEAMHFANDQVILFPILPDTYAEGSLAEVGFSILNAIRIDNLRNFVILIDPLPAEHLKENMKSYNTSVRMRGLVREHLRKLEIDTLYLVDTLDEMLEVSIPLYKAAELALPLSRYNPHRRPR